MIRRVISLLRGPSAAEKQIRRMRAEGLIGPGTEIGGSIGIRQPGGLVRVGAGCLIEGSLITERPQSRLTVKDNVYVGGGTLVDCVLSITIEEDVLISYGCILADSDNHSLRYSIRKQDVADWKRRYHNWDAHEHRPVVVRRGAWIGAHSIILKGVEIGVGSVVGAGSVVTRSVPDWTIVGGNPARIIRQLGPNER